MAEQLVEDLLGEGLLDAVRKLRRAMGTVSDEGLAWLREVAHPPPGVRLVSADGATFTGVVLVERSDVVVMLAARHTPGIPVPPSAPPASPAAGRGLTLAERLDPDDPIWDRDINPYHR
ncbi:MAG: hypothetical protein KC731_09700 [Myxococcales bacterium]|nr:hypothetical protein [Myxococcales bacterium]